MLWNLLYNKSLMGKPAVGSSLYPEMAKEGGHPGLEPASASEKAVGDGAM